MPEIAIEEASLIHRREAYAHVTVVWARRPVSAQAGDVALVTAEGRLRGWVGGSCSEPVVVRQALEALADGTPRLVHLAPPAELPADREGMVVVPLTCASEGSLEVFVEPRLPKPHLVVLGRAPVVRALATMAGAVGFEVAVVERDDIDLSELDGITVIQGLDLAKAGVGPDSFVVVATMGRYDEDAVEAALATGARYVALVASARRAAAVQETLALGGMAAEALAEVRAPAGLALGELPHNEIAVAILAEIVAEKAARRAARSTGVTPPQPTEELALDPVCGMSVDVHTPGDVSVRAGVTYRFCGSGCRRRFDADPDAFLASGQAVHQTRGASRQSL